MFPLKSFLRSGVCRARVAVYTRYLSEKYNLYKKERFHKIIFAWAGNYSDVLEIAQVETVLRVGENSYVRSKREK